MRATFVHACIPALAGVAHFCHPRPNLPPIHLRFLPPRYEAAVREGAATSKAADKADTCDSAEMVECARGQVGVWPARLAGTAAACLAARLAGCARPASQTRGA